MKLLQLRKNRLVSLVIIVIVFVLVLVNLLNQNENLKLYKEMCNVYPNQLS